VIFIIPLPFIAERLMQITLPFGVKSMIPCAFFMNSAGGIEGWYWELSWIYYDKLSHLVAGFALSLTAFSCFLILILYTTYGKGMHRRSVLIGTSLVTLMLALLWEFEEIAVDNVIHGGYSGGFYDTVGDMTATTAGLILSLIVIKLYINRVPPDKSLATLLSHQKH
jgi:hypothetical protein